MSDINQLNQHFFGRKELEILGQESKPPSIKINREPSKVDENYNNDTGVVGYMGNDEDLESIKYDIMDNINQKMDNFDDRIEKLLNQIQKMDANRADVVKNRADIAENTTEIGDNRSLMEENRSEIGRLQVNQDLCCSPSAPPGHGIDPDIGLFSDPGELGSDQEPQNNTCGYFFSQFPSPICSPDKPKGNNFLCSPSPCNRDLCCSSSAPPESQNDLDEKKISIATYNIGWGVIFGFSILAVFFMVKGTDDGKYKWVSPLILLTISIGIFYIFVVQNLGGGIMDIDTTNNIRLKKGEVILYSVQSLLLLVLFIVSWLRLSPMAKKWVYGIGLLIALIAGTFFYPSVYPSVIQDKIYLELDIEDDQVIEDKDVILNIKRPFMCTIVLVALLFACIILFIVSLVMTYKNRGSETESDQLSEIKKIRGLIDGRMGVS